MSIRRGDVVMARFPFASGQGAKRRPCLIVQNDADNQRLANTVITQITSNLRRRGDKSHFIDKVIGSLPSAAMQQVNNCLKAGLELP